MSTTAQEKIVADFEKKLFDSALGTDHAYRKLNRLINFDKVATDLQKLYSNLGQPGIPAVRGLKAMLLQFWEDYSDREMEAEERERAIKDGHDKLNNLIIKDYAADKQARWGAKSKKNIWFGYKRHTAVDMRYGLISKTTVTPANVLDYQVVEQICPKEGYIFMDKLYDTKDTDTKIRASGCSPGTIRKNNNQTKNYDLDRWRSHMRMPYEGTFSKLPKRARYRGQTKVAFQNFGQSLTYNLKKAITYLPQSAYN